MMYESVNVKGQRVYRFTTDSHPKEVVVGTIKSEQERRARIRELRRRNGGKPAVVRSLK